MIPQLFQSLRVGKDMGNLIGDFFIRKSQQHVSVAHNVLWFCGVECVQPDREELSKRKVPLPNSLKEDNLPEISQKLRSRIKEKLSRLQREFFDTETNFFEKVTSISGLLHPSESKDQKKMKIKEQLVQYNQDIPECVYLPTNQNCKVVSIVTTSGTPMQSAARVPILVSFEVEDYPGPDHDQILKNTDEISQLVSQTGLTLSKSAFVEMLASIEQFEKSRYALSAPTDVEFDEQQYDNISDEREVCRNEANFSQLKQSVISRTIASKFARAGQFQRSQSSAQVPEKHQQEGEREDERQFMKAIKDEAFCPKEDHAAFGDSTMNRKSAFYQNKSGKLDIRRQFSTILTMTKQQ